MISNNLTKYVRVKNGNVMISILIPVPNEPRMMEMFCILLVEELLILNQGITAIDGWKKERFVLKAHIVKVLGDMMAIRKLLLFKGPNATRPCRFCTIKGKISDSLVGSQSRIYNFTYLHSPLRSCLYVHLCSTSLTN